jgi:hypothetical protein
VTRIWAARNGSREERIDSTFILPMVNEIRLDPIIWEIFRTRGKTNYCYLKDF